MPRVGRAFVGTLALANLALWMGFFTPVQLLLPQQLEDISGDAGKVGALGRVTGAGALVAVVVTPIAGALSDRTTSRWGRRLPWLVGGTALALAVLSRQSTVAGVLIGWCVAQGLLNAAYAGLTAEVPDHVPVAQRLVGVAAAAPGLRLGLADPVPHLARQRPRHALPALRPPRRGPLRAR